jgi:alkylhydroperoxidase family enzyme
MFQRYQLTDYVAASQGSRKVYDDFCIATGTHRLPAWLASMGHHPALARAWWELTKACLHSGHLPLLLKELVMYQVARETGAAYCEALHADAVLQLDGSLKAQDLPRLLQADHPGRLPPQHLAALELAACLARSPHAASDADFERLLRLGFQRAEIHELVSVVSLALMFCSYTSMLRLPLETGRPVQHPDKASGHRLAEGLRASAQ